MRRCFLLLAVVLLAATEVAAQQALDTPEPTEVVLGGVNASLEKDTFIIRYQIDLGEQVKECDVMLYLSMDGGKVFFENPLKNGLAGDVGRIRRSGEKRINYLAPSEFLVRMVDNPIVFKVVVSNIKYKFGGSVSVGEPLVVRWDNTELVVSLPVEASGKNQIRWKGICYSDKHDSPTFRDSEVKRFIDDVNSEKATMSLPIVPGKTYYVRGFAIRGDNGWTVYGETIRFTIPTMDLLAD